MIRTFALVVTLISCAGAANTFAFNQPSESKPAGIPSQRSANHAGPKRVKITMRRARAIALAQVRGGKIKSSELEREKGQLIYSFDIRAGTGIKEVHVDAYTGKVLEVSDETAAGEADEQRNERKQKHP